ncbi:MAG: porin family protein [Bacteroidia bacterium]
MRLRHTFILLAFWSWAGLLLAQSPLQLGVRAGAMLGGPIPAESDPDSSDGTLLVGPSGGIFLAYQPAPRWRLELGLHYAMKGATYQQLYRNDTMMPIEIFPGTVDTVPTFYYADVNGKMRLHYIDLPLTAQFNVAKGAWVHLGGYASILLGGKDAGTADIQIGDGTVFPDTTISFNNIAEIRRMDAGLVLGGGYELPMGLGFEFRAQRSLVGLYRKGFMASQGLEEIPLFHTQFFIGLRWRFGAGAE